MTTLPSAFGGPQPSGDSQPRQRTARVIKAYVSRDTAVADRLLFIRRTAPDNLSLFRTHQGTEDEPNPRISLDENRSIRIRIRYGLEADRRPETRSEATVHNQKGFGQAVFRAKSQAQHQIALQKTAVPALELKREQTHAALEAAVRHPVERLKLPPKEASERGTAAKNGAGSQPHAGFPVEVHRHLIFLLIAAF